jgi:hypothetical protein
MFFWRFAAGLYSLGLEIEGSNRGHLRSLKGRVARFLDVPFVIRIFYIACRQFIMYAHSKKVGGAKDNCKNTISFAHGFQHLSETSSVGSSNKKYKFDLEYVQCIRFLVTFVLARYSLLANGSDYPFCVARPRFQVWCDEVGSDTRNMDNTAQPRLSPERVEYLFDDSINTPGIPKYKGCL